MSRTRIKICGITRPEDAALAAELGADAIGLNFVRGPRQLDLERGREIVQSLFTPPMRPNIVALCGWRGPEAPNCLTTGEVANNLRVDRFQIYGQSELRLADGEDGVPYWMVASISGRKSITDLAIFLGIEKLRPLAILLDTASSTQLGGTGQSFNWNWIAEARAAGELAKLPPIILAGGLTPENVAEAIRIAQPYAVDVSSGVEAAGKPGVKDSIKMRDFIQAVQGS
ncbi:MAG TPA: phosphoribosylanthranilate isomerase [Phycisphaerae bacterium]|jgi:phosphoribosylanthranilate isomerase